MANSGTPVGDGVHSSGTSWTAMGKDEPQIKSGDSYQSRVNPFWTDKNNKVPPYLVLLQLWKPKVELKRMVQQEHYVRRESKYETSPYHVW